LAGEWGAEALTQRGFPMLLPPYVGLNLSVPFQGKEDFGEVACQRVFGEVR
jgi:hypothetical protein